MKAGTSVPVAIFVFAFSFIIGNCSTTIVEEKDPPNERHPLQVVEECPLVMQTGIELSGSKPQLYILANDWIEFILAETEEDILSREPEEGVVIGRGVITQSSGKVDYEFEYQLIVEAVDDMVTTTIVCYYGVGQMNDFLEAMIVTEPHLLPPNDYKKVKNQFSGVVDEFAAYLENGCLALEYNEKGIAKAESGDIEGAISDFTTAIDIHPHYFGSYDNRGIAYRILGNYEDAITDHTKALELGGDNYGVYYNRGNARLFMGDIEGAIADYTMAIEINPNDYSLYEIRSVAKSDSGDYEGALDDLDKAIEINPEYPVAFNNRGWIYVKQERYREAISDLDKALALSDEAAFYDTRGWACFFLDQLEEARQDALSALALDPDLHNARALLFRIEVQEGNADEASRSLNYYLSNAKGMGIEDDYLLVLRYFANEIPLDSIKNNPQWDDLSVALRYY